MPKFTDILVGYVVWAWGAMFGVVIWALLKYILAGTTIADLMNAVGASADVTSAGFVLVVATLVGVVYVIKLRRF